MVLHWSNAFKTRFIWVPEKKYKRSTKEVQKKYKRSTKEVQKKYKRKDIKMSTKKHKIQKNQKNPVSYHSPWARCHGFSLSKSSNRTCLRGSICATAFQSPLSWFWHCSFRCRCSSPGKLQTKKESVPTKQPCQQQYQSTVAVNSSSQQ
jgi:hypothetical protein